jgi:integrase
MSRLITHFRERELADLGDDGRAYSTRDRYESNLNAWIEPRWGSTRIDEIKAPMVEEWLRNLRCKPRRRKKLQIGQAKMKPTDLKRLARGTKAKIRNLLSVLYNHAIRWSFNDCNPISGPTKGSGVRQSSKREKVPDILEVEEIQRIIPELQLRERVLLFLDMASGLRRGELAGVKWLDCDFESLDADIQRSIVDQVVGRCKTEASQKRIPLDEYTAQDLLAWRQVTPYNQPEDYVFALPADVQARSAVNSRFGSTMGPRPFGGISAKSFGMFGVPDGIRTRVTAVKGTLAAVTHCNHWARLALNGSLGALRNSYRTLIEPTFDEQKAGSRSGLLLARLRSSSFELINKLD